MKYEFIVSACLCGVSCRYDGQASTVDELAALSEQGRALAVCPEVEGGLGMPRHPCERLGERVLGKDGSDVTGQFVAGAEKTLELAREHGIRLAVLKERSPSCGSGVIYDGSFSGRRIQGRGVTAELLLRHGLTVVNEEDFYDYI